MTWKQHYIDFAIMLIREKGRPRDVASIFSISPTMVYALLKSRGFQLKELKKMPPLPQKDRGKIIKEFCKDQSNLEVLRSTLQSHGICFEDFLTQPLSSFTEHIEIITPKTKQGIRERDKEIAELRRRGATLRAIGEQFGITRERVRQVVLLFNRHSDNPVDIVRARQLGYQPSPEKLARLNKIVELCQSGLTYRQIADAMGLEKKYVFQDLARYNHTAEQPLRARREDNRKVTDEVKESIVRGRKKGITNFALARQFGVSYGTICRVIKEAGLTRPRQTPKKVRRKRVKQTSIKKRTAKGKTKAKRVR